MKEGSLRTETGQQISIPEVSLFQSLRHLKSTPPYSFFLCYCIQWSVIVREPRRTCSLLELFERSGPVHIDVLTPYVYSNLLSGVISDWRLVQNDREIWSLIPSAMSFIPAFLEHPVFLRDNIEYEKKKCFVRYITNSPPVFFSSEGDNKLEAVTLYPGDEQGYNSQRKRWQRRLIRNSCQVNEFFGCLWPWASEYLAWQMV